MLLDAYWWCGMRVVDVMRWVAAGGGRSVEVAGASDVAEVAATAS